MHSSTDYSTNQQTNTKYSDLNKSVESKEKKEGFLFWIFRGTIGGV